MEEVTGATLAVSGSLKLESESIFQELKLATRDCCFFRSTVFTELRDLHELEMGSALHQKVSLVPADPSCRTCSSQGQNSYTHNVFGEETSKTL